MQQLDVETEVNNKYLIDASCWFFLSSHFAHDARSQEPKAITLVTHGWKYQATTRPEIFHNVTLMTAIITLCEYPS